MSRHLSMTEIRLNNIVACLTPVIPLLMELNDGFGTPFVQALVNTTVSLVNLVPKVKRNREECGYLMENIHGVLYAIITLHMTSESKGSLPPATIEHIGKFTETLHKIHSFISMQQEGNKIKQFFRQNEVSTLLKDCHEGLQQALTVFKTNIDIFTANIAEMRNTAETMHKELIELISTLSDGTSSDRSSSVGMQFLSVTSSDVVQIYQYPNGSQKSSSSFCMLPSKPKIFHGRDTELREILAILHTNCPRIAILGAGGMGKTSLARAALHNPEIAAKYEHRFFIACDSPNTSIGVAALLGAHIGLKPGKDLTKPILRYFSSRPASLLILDNLETSWEPISSRNGVEEFLSLLTDIQHLALIITMRGAERPAKVRWTRPFLKPLKPLGDDAAWQTFIDIAGESHNHQDVDRLLRLTDNMPLAVDLIAHMADHEGCSNILSRWETERTSLMSSGNDRRSSMDASIALSVSSSRMNSSPGAKDLLSLLSILPDGLSDNVLIQSRLCIPELLACKTTLLGTALAYIDDNNRLKVLVPIQEYILQFHPPSTQLVEPLHKYFRSLLDLYDHYRGQIHTASKVNEITANLGNIRQLIQPRLTSESPELLQAIECTILLNSFQRFSGHGWLDLMDSVPNMLPQPRNYKLEAQYIVEVLNSTYSHPVSTLDNLIAEVVSHLHGFNDPVLESRFYRAVGWYYYHYSKNDPAMVMEFFEKGLSLQKSSGSTSQQIQIHNTIAQLNWRTSNYTAAQAHARQGRTLAQMSGNCYEEARALLTEAMCCTSRGNYKQTILLLNRGKTLLGLCGIRGTLYWDMQNIEAEVHLLKTEYTEARKIQQDMLQNITFEQEPNQLAFCLLNIAQIDGNSGADKDEVHKSLHKAKMIFQANEYPTGIRYSDMILAELNLRGGNKLAAKMFFEKEARSTRGSDSQSISFCLERLADISRWRATDFPWTSHWTLIYLVHSLKTEERLSIHKALQFLADLFLMNEDEETAHNLLVVALDGFTYMDIHHSRGSCMLRLGDLAQHRGESQNAVELWKNARPLFDRSSQTESLAQVDDRLSAADRDHQKLLTHLVSLHAPNTLSENTAQFAVASMQEEQLRLEDKNPVSHPAL